jgi:hypothetical protein
MKKIISIFLSMIFMTVIMTSCNTKEDPHTFDDIEIETTTPTETTTEETTTTAVIEPPDYDYLTYYWADPASYVINDLESQGYELIEDLGNRKTYLSSYAGQKIADRDYRVFLFINENTDTVNSVEIHLNGTGSNVINYKEDYVPVFQELFEILDKKYGDYSYVYSDARDADAQELFLKFLNGEYICYSTFGFQWIKDDYTAIGLYSQDTTNIYLSYFHYELKPTIPDETINNNDLI